MKRFTKRAMRTLVALIDNAQSELETALETNLLEMNDTEEHFVQKVEGNLLNMKNFLYEFASHHYKEEKWEEGSVIPVAKTVRNLTKMRGSLEKQKEAVAEKLDSASRQMELFVDMAFREPCGSLHGL